MTNPVIQNLMGLKPNERKFWFVSFSPHQYNFEGKFYFETCEEASNFFASVSNFNPITLQNEYLGTWDSDLKTKKGTCVIDKQMDFFIPERLEIILGMEVVSNCFDTREERTLAKATKYDELKQKVKELEKQEGKVTKAIKTETPF